MVKLIRYLIFPSTTYDKMQKSSIPCLIVATVLKLWEGYKQRNYNKKLMMRVQRDFMAR